MRIHRRLAKLLSVLVGGGLMAFALPACQPPTPHTALVVGDGTQVAISQSTIQAGKNSFTVINNDKVPGSGTNIALFRLKGNAGLARVALDLNDEFSQTPAIAARGTRELVRDISAVGLADLVGPTRETVTVNLSVGTYYLMDLARATAPKFTPLHVTAGAGPGALQGFSVKAATVGTADRFVAPNVWPHAGTYLFTNTSTDTLHFMDLVRVKPGTTDAEVQAALNSSTQGPPPFLLKGPSGGNDVVSPGQSVQVTYNLPAGTYVLLCFIADVTTGMPHALMGMHKVITLK